MEKREIRFKAYVNLGKFSVMLEDVHLLSDSIGYYIENLIEALEATDWKLNDDDQFENKITGEKYDADSVGWLNTGEDYLIFEKYDLLQFTGLLDKDKKEIYEGYFLRRTKKNVLGENSIAEVLWKDSGWQINSKHYGYCQLTALRASESEVIGNIFENQKEV